MTRSLMTSLALLLALPAAAVDVPEVRTVVFDNGLTVMLREDHSVPLVNVELRSRAGSLLDPEGKEGLSDLAATVMMYGTKTRTEDQIDEQLALLGAQLYTGSGSEVFYVGGNVPTIEEGALRKFLEIVADVTRNPTFPEAGVKRALSRRLGQLRGLPDDRSTLAELAFMKWTFPDHPYGRSTSGTLSSVGSMSRDDLVSFHQRYVLPDDAALGLSGDFDPDEVIEILRRLFGDPSWGEICEGEQCERRCVRPSGRAFCTRYRTEAAGPRINPIPNLQPPALPPGTRILLVDTGDATLNQAQIRYGAPMRRLLTDPQWTEAHLATELLGGDFNARLNARLRVKEGLTYGARWVAQWDDIQSGAGYLSTFTSPKDVVRALKLTLEEIKRLQTEPVPEQELQQTKDRLTRGFVFRFETAANVLSEYLRLWQERQSKERLASYPDRVQSVTRGQLDPVLSDLPTEDISIVVVANSALKKDLQAFAESRGGTLEVVTPAWLGLQ